MNIVYTREGPLTLAALSGRLDTVTSTAALADLTAQVDHPSPRLILDASLLEYVSSAGLRTLLGLAKKIRAAGGKMAISGMTEGIREIYEISGFHSVIPPYADVAAAREALSK